MTVQELIYILNNIPDKTTQVFTYHPQGAVVPADTLVLSSKTNEIYPVFEASKYTDFYILRSK